MTDLLRFSMGGIDIPEYKITQDCPICDIELPKSVQIPVKQHIGSPAKILVKKGDKVKVGSILAAYNGIISSNIHSSVSGIVTKLEDVINSNGFSENMITIETQGDIWEDSIDKTSNLVKDIDYTPSEIIAKIRNSGIVGLGGAGFPTDIKASVPEDKKVSMLIINGIECEPFITSDERLMIEKSEEIIMGARIINRALGIQNAIIAIDENKTYAIKKLTELSKRYIGVNIKVCKNKYPQGSEKQLIKSIIGKELPSGKLPVDIGCIVQNIATVFAVYEAVQKNKPLFERIITVSGNGCLHPNNYRVRIGTPISHIIEQSGGLSPSVNKVVTGGPMMGKSIINLEAPVTKLTSGIVLFKDHDFAKQEASACIRCGKCVISCPIGLRPYAICEAVTLNHRADYLHRLHAGECIECGCCAYICPAHIPLLDYCKIAKQDIRKK